MITIYTDGSFQSSINAGGYAAVVYENGQIVKEMYQGHKDTTNNREELRGVIEALRYLPADEKAEVVSDSQYVLNNLQYCEEWFHTDEGLATKKNLDLWWILLDLYKSHPNVTYRWTKGHADDEGNIRADLLATHAAQCLNLQSDTKWCSNYKNWEITGTQV